MRSPLTIIFILRQWIFNLEGGGGGGGIIRGRQLFETFPSKAGGYLREAINRGTAIIRGNTVNMSSIIIVKCLYNVYIIFFVEY